MTTYISPSLPGMIRNLWKSDPSERSVRTALNLAGDLIQELIDLRDQPAAEHVGTERPGVGNADTGDISAEPSDAEIQAAARALDPEAWETDLSEERGADRHMIRGRRISSVTLARAALVAAREATRHE